MSASNKISERTGRIYKAIVTSFLSKGCTLILQLTSLPLAARHLGPEEFSVYAAFSAILALITASDFGVGPSLGRRIAAFSAADNKSGTARVFAAGLAGAILISGTVFLVGSLWLSFDCGIIGISDASRLSDETQRTLWIILAISAMQILFSTGGRARQGFQETHVNNIFGFFGNLLVLGALYLALQFPPSVLFLVVSIYGLATLAHGANLAFLLYQRPYLLAVDTAGLGKEMIRLAANSLVFAVSVGLLSWQREGAKLILAKTGDALAVAEYTILVGFAATLGGIVVMGSAPLWPAIADACARGDGEWLGRAYIRVSNLSNIYALAGAAVIAVIGKEFTSLLYGASYPIPNSSFWVLALFFVVFIMGHVRFTWQIGLGRERLLLFVILLEAGFNSLLISLIADYINASLLLGIFTSTHLLFSVILVDVLVVATAKGKNSFRLIPDGAGRI